MSAFHETFGVLRQVFHIKDGIITITPMKSRIEAIQKLEHTQPQLKDAKVSVE